MPTRRLVGLAVLLFFAIAALVIAFVGALLSFIFRMIDQTPAHVCGLALVQRSPAAIRLVGSPIAQHGFTGGRSRSANGEDYEHITFWVRGPLGDAFVVSEGLRSPLDSHLSVRIGRNGESELIYSGPFDCPERHR
ncbi:MAG: cytochrome c oxidase assembly factor Coa1 family protein [Candidatus Cybelea sp.]